MAADIEAGPVVNHLRGRIGGSLRVGPRGDIGRECGGRECDQGCCAKQKFFHIRSPNYVVRPSTNNVVSVWLLRGAAGATDVFIVTKPPQFGFHPTHPGLSRQPPRPLAASICRRSLRSGSTFA